MIKTNGGPDWWTDDMDQEYQRQRRCLHLTADSQLRCPGCGWQFASEQEWCAVSDAAIAAWQG